LKVAPPQRGIHSSSRRPMNCIVNLSVGISGRKPAGGTTADDQDFTNSVVHFLAS
jgi:hypothetical protein